MDQWTYLGIGQWLQQTSEAWLPPLDETWNFRMGAAWRSKKASRDGWPWLKFDKITVKVAKIKVSRKSYSKLKAALKVECVTQSGRVLTKHSLASFVVGGNQSSSQWDPKNCRQSPSNFGPGWIFNDNLEYLGTYSTHLGFYCWSSIHVYICQRYMSNVPNYIHLYPHSNMLMVASVTSQKYCQSRYSQLLSANST